MKQTRQTARRLLALVLLAGVLLLPGCGAAQGSAQVLRTVTYPTQAAYPQEADYVAGDGTFDADGYDEAYTAWLADRPAALPQTQRETLDAFCTASIPTFLNTETENPVYAPLNVYLALSMLCPATDGQTQQQLFDLLCVQDLPSLESLVDALWQANYIDDGQSVSRFANALWLEETIDFSQAVLDTLAQTWRAQTCQGKMGSDALNTALRDWFSAQTGGLLDAQAAQQGFRDNTVLAVTSTAYYKAAWSDPFWQARTADGCFQSANGEVHCDFMYQSQRRALYRGNNYSAVCLELQSGGAMWLFLPDAGTQPRELLKTQEWLASCLSEGCATGVQELQVNLSVPKFDVVSQRDLCDGLRKLGLTDLLEVGRADFSPLCETADGLYLSQVAHDARVTIDEEGVSAAAYTIAAVSEAAELPPEEEIDLVFDRPFLFALTSADNLPLFTGIVDCPV